MSQELVPITPAPIIPASAVNFGSRFMQVKPATLVINQPNTQAEGAIRGHLRIVEQNLQFERMKVTLLAEPQESRAWYAGEKDQMNRTPENLMCYSHDLRKPHEKAKVPQAMQCGRFENGRFVDTCPKASWEAWRKKKDETGQKDPKLIPPCEKSLKLALIDTQYKIPLYMYLRSNAKKRFEDQMDQLARAFELLRAQGKNPSWFDLSFELSTKSEKNNNNTVSYLPVISNVKYIAEDERALFGDIFLRFTNRGRMSDEDIAQAEADAATENTNNAINAAVSEPGSTGTGTPTEGEYITI